MRRYPQILHQSLSILLLAVMCLAPLSRAIGQDPVTGAFEGQVTDSVTGNPVPGATVQIINKDTQVPLLNRPIQRDAFVRDCCLRVITSYAFRDRVMPLMSGNNRCHPCAQRP
jgi:hypothetical protein